MKHYWHYLKKELWQLLKFLVISAPVMTFMLFIDPPLYVTLPIFIVVVLYGAYLDMKRAK